MQASLDYRQRLQQLFFPEGIAYDGNRFNRTAATAPLFKYLAPSESADERVDGDVHLRPSGYGGQPSRGLPTVAHATVAKRERRLERETGLEPATSTLARSHSTTELFPLVENILL